MSNVIPLGNITRLAIPPEDILEQAKGTCTDAVLVLGYDDDGAMYFSSSSADGGEVLWLLEQAKLALLTVE